jgi:hypothetical protein
VLPATRNLPAAAAAAATRGKFVKVAKVLRQAGTFCAVHYLAGRCCSYPAQDLLDNCCYSLASPAAAVAAAAAAVEHGLLGVPHGAVAAPQVHAQPWA